MLKRFSALLILLVGFFVVSSVSLSAQNLSASDSGRVANSTIDRKVRKEILSLPYYGVFDAIDYQINGDTVTLSGYTVRPLTKSDAEDAVKDVTGVRNVVNKIQVLPLSPSDDRIRVRTYNALANAGSLYRYLLGSSPAIHIIVNNGHVRLAGFVNSQGDKDLANITAREIFGVFDVTNDLQVENQQR